MRRSTRIAENQAKVENDFQREPKAEKKRSNAKVTAIAVMDNGTMVQAFKYLNYCQLAKNSLVSKRFRNLIRTHRHSLALLYVDAIGIVHYPADPGAIKIFRKELSLEEYNEWVIRNNYSKQAPIEDQIVSTENTHNIPSGYRLYARAQYNDLNHREWYDETIVLSAQVEVNHENWPVFQHFVRLATDPFIYIDRMKLTGQNNVLSIISDRLQCKILNFILNGNTQESITWVKDHVRCNQLSIRGDAGLIQDELFLDFFVTGGQCTPSIHVGFHHVSEALVEFVQKFLHLENWDEYQGVQSIESSHIVKNQDIQVWKKDYSKFIVKEERDENHRSTEHVFEFTNNAIGMKLQFIVTIFDTQLDYWFWHSGSHTFSLKIHNL